MIQAIPFNKYFLIKKYLQSFRKMCFCAVLSLGCRIVCLYSAKFDNHVLTFSVYFVLMYILFLCYSVFSNTLSTRKPFHSSTHLCSSVTLSFITSTSFTCQPCSLVYLYYYIYLPCNRFFCVVPLHRHQERRDDERSFNEPNNL